MPVIHALFYIIRTCLGTNTCVITHILSHSLFDIIPKTKAFDSALWWRSSPLPRSYCFRVHCDVKLYSCPILAQMSAQNSVTDKLISVAIICRSKLISGQSKPVMHNNVNAHAMHPMILMMILKIFIRFGGIFASYNSIFLIFLLRIFYYIIAFCPVSGSTIARLRCRSHVRTRPNYRSA